MSLVLGVLGGMGPAATLEFLGKVHAFTGAKRDQDHIRTIVDINPQIPDRADPVAKPGPVLAEMAGALRGAGADVLAIASNSAHVHADLITRAAGLPLIDMIAAGAMAARETGAHRVGVLGTRPALRLYREYLAAQGLGMVTLPSDQQEAFVALLARIRAGEREKAVGDAMARLVDRLAGEGAEAIIGGSNAISLVYAPTAAKPPYIDASEALARRCVAVCLELAPAPT
jgi:aspartate racemase